MAQATSSALGEIKLAGDLAGSNNALQPELTATGVTAGQYVVPTLNIDIKGRITSASNTPGQDIAALVPDATVSNKGLVKIGSGLSVSGGTVTVNAPADATSTTKGVVQVGSGLSASNGTISIDASQLPNATTTTKGVVQVGSGFNVDGSGVISLDLNAIPTGTASAKGMVQTGSGVAVNAGVISVDTNTIDKATSSTLGVVSVGTGLVVSNGVVSLDLNAIADATTSVKGKVQVGANIDVNAGVISVADATTTTKGVASVSGTGLLITNGVLSLNRSTGSYASSTTAGLVKVGNGLQIDAYGVLNIDQTTLPYATATTRGIVTIANDGSINLNSGIISIPAVPPATETTLGAIKVGSNLSADANGLLSVNYTYPDASYSSKGILKVTSGYGLNISSGVLSVQTASTSQYGTVSVGTGLAVDGSGVLSAPVASNLSHGIVKLDGTTVVSDGYGTISVVGSALPVATSSTFGGVVTGTGITNNSGVISVAEASTVNSGVVRPDNSTITISNGVLSVNTGLFIRKDQYVKTTKAVMTTPVSFTAGGTAGNQSTSTSITFDLQSSNTFIINRDYANSSSVMTINKPTNAEVGQVFRIVINNLVNITSPQTSWVGSWIFPAGYTVTSTANKTDVLECVVVAVWGASNQFSKILCTPMVTNS